MISLFKPTLDKNKPKLHPGSPRRLVVINATIVMCVTLLHVVNTSRTHTWGITTIFRSILTVTLIIVYMYLKCSCALAYVGKITDPFKRRFQKQRSGIRVVLSKTEECTQMDLNKPVAVHFVKYRHQIHELRDMVIEHVLQPNRGCDHDPIWCYSAKPTGSTGCGQSCRTQHQSIIHMFL